MVTVCLGKITLVYKFVTLLGPRTLKLDFLPGPFLGAATLGMQPSRPKSGPLWGWHSGGGDT